VRSPPNPQFHRLLRSQALDDYSTDKNEQRGIIFHGSPGNGKTMAIQSIMRDLYAYAEPIPTLYVKSFAADQGAQWSIRQIFTNARRTAPCLLVFEDIDSMVTSTLRSYFLNEVDGLESNDGIFMLGTTNHLEKLDPALAQRPSRFDRKIFFDRPSHHERAMYARFWSKNIPGTSEANFPNELCDAIADVTDGFSFAYLKELFLATLLGMAREDVTLDTPVSSTPLSEDADSVLVNKPSSVSEKESNDNEGTEKEKTYSELDKSVIWPRIKAQADILRLAIVSEEETGKSNAAGGERVSGDDDGDEFVDRRQVRRRGPVRVIR
jgi:transitional endoplasmic reticulum ATPase